jgi:hypothetical protein
VTGSDDEQTSPARISDLRLYSRKQNTPALHPASQRLPLAGLQKLFDSSSTGRPALALCGVRGRLHACCLGGTYCDATQVEMHGSVIGVHRTNDSCVSPHQKRTIASVPR